MNLRYISRGTIGRTPHLIRFKDARFGLLSRCSAIVIYHWEDLKDFLTSHDYITNKLAILVRDTMCNHEFTKIMITTVAAIGLQVISPYHAVTISKNSTHSSLKEFFIDVYNSLKNMEVTSEFFKFEKPAIECVSENIFKSAKNL